MGLTSGSGYQPNAGRPVGSINKKTLQRRAIEKQLHQKIMQKANRLLKVMMMHAEGEIFLFRIDISETEKGNKRKEHNMVTDWREIKSFFNEHAQDINNILNLINTNELLIEVEQELGELK